MRYFLVQPHHILHFMFLVVYVFPKIHKFVISLMLAENHTSLWGILMVKKGTTYMIPPLEKSMSHLMSLFMNLFFHIATCQRHLPLLILPSLLLMTNSLIPLLLFLLLNWTLTLPLMALSRHHGNNLYLFCTHILNVIDILHLT